MQLVIQFLDFVTNIGSLWAYIVVFLASFFEGLPLVGLFSPGGIAVALIGFLAKIGNVNFWFALLVSTTAALMGDCVGYSIGRKFGYDFLKKYGKYFFLKEEHHIEKARALIVSNPGKSIIFGRLSYLSRSISPFLAGAAGLPLWKFLIFGLLGSLFWSTIHILIGFVFGQGYLAAAKYVNYILLATIILIVAMFYAYRFVNKRHHVFKKYHVYTLSFNILAILIFSKVLEDVVQKSGFYNLDKIIYANISTLWNDVSITVMAAITTLGGFYCSSLLILILFFALFRQNKWYYSILAALSIFSGLISSGLIKSITHVIRPEASLVYTEYFSFPSSHTLSITILGLLYFHCLRTSIEGRLGRVFLGIGCVIVVLSVGFSRIFLGAHWLTDVLAGIALGVFWVTFYILLIRVVRYTEIKLVAVAKKSLGRLTVFYKDFKLK
jgi:membrane protein DedA with SNARE-associated domain/membrane-associated phospholipid phosphatase